MDHTLRSMHGMLSAAIILIVFALVAAVGGGSAVWLYRAAPGPSGRSRPLRDTPGASEAPDAREAMDSAMALKALGVPGVSPVTDSQENHSAPGEPAPAALPSAEAGADSAEPAGDRESPEAEPAEGARIYVLDSSRRSRP